MTNALFFPDQLKSLTYDYLALGKSLIAILAFFYNFLGGSSLLGIVIMRVAKTNAALM